MHRASHSRFASLSNLAIPLWVVTLTLVCSSLMVGHWISLPTPAVGSQLERGTHYAHESKADWTLEDGRLRVSHFLFADCPCSRKVLDYLVHRPPLAAVDERIVLIALPNQPLVEVATGSFAVELESPETLMAKYGVESAPLMIVDDAQGIIRYAGGYTSRKQGLDYQDQTIVRQLLSGAEVDPLPLYGCAVSQRLKQMVDPFGLKD